MAVRFDADESYTSASSPPADTAYTVTCWVKLSADRNTWSSVWGSDSSSSNYLYLATDSDGVTMKGWVFVGGSERTVTGPVMAVGTWYRLALVVNGVNATLYHGTATGVLSAPSVANWFTITGTTTFRVGANVFAGEWLNGCVANLKHYSTNLTQAEVERELGAYVPARTANLVRWHPFVANETTDYSGAARTLSGGVTTTREDGPPIAWLSHLTPIVTPTASAGEVSRTVTDNVGLLDGVTRVTTMITTVSNLVGVTDSVADALVEVIGSTVGVTDAVADTWTLSRLQTNNVGILDGATDTWALTRSHTDPVGLTDGVVDTWTITRTITEPVGVTDDASYTLDDTEITRTLADQVTTLDSVVVTRTSSHTLTDPVNVTDAVSRNLAKVVTDAVGVVDSLAKSLGKTTLDNVGITDSTQFTQGRTVVVTDAVGLLDSITSTDSKIALIVDLVTIQDDVSGVITGPLTQLRVRVRGFEPSHRGVGTEPHPQLVGNESTGRIVGEKVGST